MTDGIVVELWRYPVSGLQGERVESSSLTFRGVQGDHAFAIRDVALNRILDPKILEHSWGTTSGLPGMLELKARLEGTGSGSEAVISLPGGGDCASGEPDCDRRLSEALGHRVELVRYPRMVEARAKSGRTLHLLTTSALKALGTRYRQGRFDVRRFRPNILIASEAEGFVEDSWVGKKLGLASGAVIGVTKPNVRCAVTTMRQGDLEEDAGILSAVKEMNGNKLGVMGTVDVEGTVSAGDELRLL